MPRMISPSEPEGTPNLKRWTRKECEFLVENGLLTGRYELIEGEVIFKMGQKPAHAFVIVRLMVWLSALFGGECVRIQLPIDVADADNATNEPEPDAAVLMQPATAYLERNPGPADLLLVMEVSDTTLRFDLTTKALLYARAGIREYWVVDIAGRQILAHRDPTSQGYQETIAYAETENLTLLARPETAVQVASLLPPASD